MGMVWNIFLYVAPSLRNLRQLWQLDIHNWQSRLWILSSGGISPSLKVFYVWQNKLEPFWGRFGKIGAVKENLAAVWGPHCCLNSLLWGGGSTLCPGQAWEDWKIGRVAVDGGLGAAAGRGTETTISFLFDRIKTY